MINKAATIKIFLVHGEPTGLRTAELSNWSGKAIASPRTEIADLINRQELSSPGFYILTGVDPESNDRTVYIGEAENVASRLKGHSAKDFWNAAAVFVSKDDNLTKAHIRYLEGKLIERAIENGSTSLVNAASSGARLPESDAAEMDIFLEKCLQLMPVLGISDFAKKVYPDSKKDDLLYCRIKGLEARGKRTANGFIVFKDSQAVLAHRPSATTSRKTREKLIIDGTLKKAGDHYIFVRDVEFGSPSTAGSIVRGGGTNGLVSWKNRLGQTLRELEMQKA